MILFAQLIFCFFFVLPAAFFLFIVYRLASKTRQQYWKGTVTDKLHNTSEEEGKISHFYTLVVQTTEGQTRKIAVAKIMFDSCNVGDTLEKPKGKLNPVKV